MSEAMHWTNMVAVVAFCLSCAAAAWAVAWWMVNEARESTKRTSAALESARTPMWKETTHGA